MGMRTDRIQASQTQQAAEQPQPANTITANIADKVERAMDWLGGGGLIAAAGLAAAGSGLAPIGLAAAGTAFVIDQIAATVEKTHNPEAQNDGIFSDIGRALGFGDDD